MKTSLARTGLGQTLIASENANRYPVFMLKCSSVLKSVLKLLLVSITAYPQIAGAQTREFSPPLKAGQLMGVKVEDTDGVKVGTIRNLIVDTQSGKLKYAVIASGGFMGFRSALRLAPSQIMSSATTKRQTLSVNTTLDHWQGAPVFKSSQLASLGQPDHAQEIARYFHQSETHLAGTAKPPLPATGAGASGQRPESLKFASDLIGKTVINHQHQKVGEVLDLLVSFGQPHPAFAIISTGKLLQRGHQYAIPLAVLSIDGKRLMLNADSTALEQAPPFNQQVWDANPSDSHGIYSYSKAEE